MLIKYNEKYKNIDRDLVIIYYTASWCNKCKQMEPIITELSKEYKIIEVDIDDNKELAKEKGIMSIPSLQIYKENKLVKELFGLQNIEDIRALLTNG